MRLLVDTVLEKHAAGISDWLKNTQFGKWYTKTSKSPVFKAKRVVGTAALATLPLAYGAHQLAKSPQRIEKEPSQGALPAAQW